YFLKPDVFRKLLGWNVRTYQISFDGPKELHNDKRVLANGGQTFDEIWANLVDMRYVDEEFAAIVRIHVDRLNSCRIPDLLAELAQSFAGDSRFKIFLRTLSCLGGPNDSDLQVLGKEESAASLGELRNLARSQSLEVVQPNNDNHVCYAAKLNSFVIRATGSIGKCTIALDNELNDIGQLNSDGTMSFRKERLFRWVRGLESGDRAELFCPLDNIGTIDSIVTIS
ncbi:MAG TPA: hypothetical protein VES66_10370, partial [Terriglobales bacterium]|nr:hypothetical protein [Terriglobales bacterium]